MLRLFLSVDLVGSTQFKTRFTGEEGAGWLTTFQTFFTNFPIMLAGQVGFEFLDDEGSTPAVDVWKVMGDEMIFVAEPKSAEELASLLRALFNTIRLYEQKNFAQLPLRLKGAAWVAEFPERNIEVEIPELSSGDGGRHLDYIGPDIDLGFRIAKFSRPSSVVLSLDLLDILLAADNRDTLALHLVGREILKGVMFGRPYPIVWMRNAEEPFDFLPWEAEECPLTACAIASQPTSPEHLEKTIGDMRLFLRKMHGIHRPRPGLG